MACVVHGVLEDGELAGVRSVAIQKMLHLWKEPFHRLAVIVGKRGDHIALLTAVIHKDFFAEALARIAQLNAAFLAQIGMPAAREGLGPVDFREQRIAGWLAL